MVSTRSKTRKASTPLSSAPSSPSPSQPGSRASSPAPSIARSAFDSDDNDDDGDNGDDDNSDSDISSEGDHEEHCNRHSNALATHCNAITNAGKKCTRKAKVFDAEFLPVCGIHEFAYWRRSRQQAGKCQAVEECGHLCNRFALYAPPYHLCVKHDKGTTSLPCHLMQLPTELRLMIFQYLLPEDIPSYSGHCSLIAMLRVNRELYEEASTVIYTQIKFKAYVEPTFIKLFGRRWDRESCGSKFEDLAKKLCQAGAQRIRNLDVEVAFASSHIRVKGLSRGVCTEEYEVYQVRDSVRKLVQLISTPLSEPNSTLKSLKVKAAPSTRHHWGLDEAIHATFLVLEPFAALGPIDEVCLDAPSRPPAHPYRDQYWAKTIADMYKSHFYEKLRVEWLISMRKSTSSSSSQDTPRNAAEATVAIKIAFHKVEQFSQLIYKQDSGQLSAAAMKHGWTATVFAGIERVLHLARVAYEDGNLEQLSKIHEAILKRWVIAHRQQQQSLSVVANTITDMFDGDVTSRHDNFPEAFGFEITSSAGESEKFDEYWPELDVKCASSIFRSAAGSSIREEGLKVIICKDGEEQVLLKTPPVVRHLRSFKARSTYQRET